MLLRFFRINDPYRLLGLLIILLLISLPFLIGSIEVTLSELKSLILGEAVTDGKLMYVQIYDDTPPLASLLFGFIDMLFGRSLVARHILALLIIFFQASYFAIILIHNKVYTENTYLAALVFGILSFFSFDVLSFSPELLASTVLLFALNHLFNAIEFKVQRDDVLLKLGMYLGIATFIVFSYWVFLVATLFILIVFTRSGFRKIALLIFGFLIPHLLLMTFYYYRNGLDELLTNFYWSNLSLSGEMVISFKGLMALSAVPLVYFVFSVFMMNREARFTKYQSQLMQTIFLWLFFALAQVFIAREISPASLVTFIPTLSYFITHYLLLIRRKWIAEWMLWIFLVSIISINLLSKNDKINSVNYTELFPSESQYAGRIQNKKILLLGEDWGLYKNNSLGGFFMNWNLSRSFF